MVSLKPLDAYKLEVNHALYSLLSCAQQKCVDPCGSLTLAPHAMSAYCQASSVACGSSISVGHNIRPETLLPRKTFPPYCPEDLARPWTSVLCLAHTSIALEKPMWCCQQSNTNLLTHPLQDLQNLLIHEFSHSVWVSLNNQHLINQIFFLCVLPWFLCVGINISLCHKQNGTLYVNPLRFIKHV